VLIAFYHCILRIDVLIYSAPHLQKCLFFLYGLSVHSNNSLTTAYGHVNGNP